MSQEAYSKPSSRHSSLSNDHYSPGYIVDIAREVLGGTIDLDPASNLMANKYIQAKTIYTINDNGLKKHWHGTVWLNPPGGKDGGASVQCAWWRKLTQEYQAGRVTSAVFLGFSIEILQTSQSYKYPVASFPLCIPRKRIDFLQSHGNTLKEGTGSTHASVIAFLAPKDPSKTLQPHDQAWLDFFAREHRQRFAEKFRTMGAILNV